ncbi:MAG: carboxypeptidase regulatory-like domain-containing protein, partial [Thermoleophilia bacterium]|nr:carboxypeptidase regulatory-like domain-containing protein [Thermoleophilia bacterium]
TLLCHNNGDGSFTNVYDDVVDAGANATGVAWADYDNDGFLDVAQGNGVLPQYNESGPSNPFLYHNNGDGTFNQIAASEGMTAQRRYRAVIWADFNVDGHVDLLMAGEDGYSCLYENAGPSTDGNWLRVRTLTSATGDATDGSPVRDALGARVEVNLDNDDTFPPYRTLMRTIDGGSGFMSQNEQIAQFGLGTSDTVAVRVRFPDGTIVVQTDVAVNQQIEIDDVASGFGTVAGVVTELISGDPVGGVTVSCDGLCSSSDYDGSYVIGGVPAGPARVVLARSSSYALRAITNISVSADAITTVDVGVCPAGFGAIGGTVTDAATSDPVAGATVSCGTPNTTDPDGNYLFYVPAGEGYTLSVVAEGYATQKQVNVTIEEGQLLEFDFALEEMEFGSVAGAVSSSATGLPIPYARVTAAYIPDPDTQIKVCYESVADETGAYLFDLLPAVAGYKVTASASGYYNRSHSGITVGAETVTDVDVVLTAEFGDVPQGFWAYDQVGACVAVGIVAGYGDGTYKPGNPVCRDQMAVYIARAIAGGDEAVPEYTGTPTFPDVPSPHWALRYVEYAVDHEVVGGYGDGTYHPECLVNRGQMAVFVARAMAGGDSNVPAYTGIPSFPDVGSSFWAYDYVQYIADDRRNVTQGYPDGLYHPEYVVNRDQMAVYVARAFGLLD